MSFLYPFKSIKSRLTTLRNPPLQLHQCVKYRFGAWWTSGNIDMDGNYSVDSLNCRVVIVKPAARRTCAEGHNPLRLGHLLIDPRQDRCQFLIYRTYHHKKVRLSWAETGQKRTETIDIIRRHRQGHVFHRTTSRRKRVRENRIFSCPIDRLFDARKDHRFYKQSIFAIF